MKDEKVRIFAPGENTVRTMQTIRNASYVCQIVVTITSSIGVYFWASEIALKYLPPGAWITPYAAIAFGALAGYFAGYITDIGFGRVLQDVLFRSLAANHPNIRKWEGGTYFTQFQRVETWMKWGLLCLLLAMDVASMYVITDPVTRAAGRDAITDIEALRAALVAKQAEQVSALHAQAREKGRTIAADERRVAQSNPALVRLRSEGNGWGSSTLEKKQSSATRSDRAAKASIEQSALQARSQGMEYTAARVAEAAAQNKETEQRNRDNRAIAATMYLLFTVGLKVLTIFLRIMIVVSFIAYSYHFRPDITNDGVIDYLDAEEFAATGGTTPNFMKARWTR